MHSTHPASTTIAHTQCNSDSPRQPEGHPRAVAATAWCHEKGSPVDPGEEPLSTFSAEFLQNMNHVSLRYKLETLEDELLKFAATTFM